MPKLKSNPCYQAQAKNPCKVDSSGRSGRKGFKLFRTLFEIGLIVASVYAYDKYNLKPFFDDTAKALTPFIEDIKGKFRK